MVIQSKMHTTAFQFRNLPLHNGGPIAIPCRALDQGPVNGSRREPRHQQAEIRVPRHLPSFQNVCRPHDRRNEARCGLSGLEVRSSIRRGVELDGLLAPLEGVNASLVARGTNPDIIFYR